MSRQAYGNIAFLGEGILGMRSVAVSSPSEEGEDAGFRFKRWCLVLIPAPGPAGTTDAILAISEAFTS